MSSSKGLGVLLDMCPGHRSIKEVISLKIDISVNKKIMKIIMAALQRVVKRMHVLQNLFLGDVFISPTGPCLQLPHKNADNRQNC